MKLTFAVVLSAVLLSSSAGAYEEVKPVKSGAIKGVIHYKGLIPKRKVIKTKNDKACHPTVLSEDLIVTKPKDAKENDLGRIVNAVVFIEEIEEGKSFPEKKLTVDQKGCVFVPHVVVVPVETTLTVINSDNTLHNVHTQCDLNMEVNKSMPGKGETSLEFDEVENVRVKCDVHPWMNSWIVVCENPYYGITGEDGTFTMEKVPAGTHTIKVWHETLGEQEKQVTVKAGETTEVEFTFKK